MLSCPLIMPRPSLAKLSSSYILLPFRGQYTLFSKALQPYFLAGRLKAGLNNDEVRCVVFHCLQPSIN